MGWPRSTEVRVAVTPGKRPPGHATLLQRFAAARLLRTLKQGVPQLKAVVNLDRRVEG